MTDRKKWEELATKELRGKPLESLEWDTLEGIKVKPLYAEDDLAGMDHLGNTPGMEPFTRGVKATMYAGRPGPSANTRASRPPRNRTPFTARRWPPVSKVSRSLSIWPRTAATIPITRAWWAMSVRPVWRLTASRI